MGIEARNLTKTFNNKLALDDVDYNFKSNQITGLIGFNGSGKTTTFNILTNFITNYDGEVLYDGKLLNIDILRQISYLSAGEEQSNNETYFNHLKYFAHAYRIPNKELKDKIKELAQQFHLREKFSTKIRELSKGNQQKVKVIGAFLNPNLKYLFLDEPFDGLDPIMVEIMKKVIIKKTHELGLTTIITSHRMNVINDMCDSYFILKEGKLIDYVDSTDGEGVNVIIKANKEIVPSKSLKKMKEVISIYDSGHAIFITILNKNSIKKITKELIECENYIEHSVTKETVAERVFRKYE